MPTEKVHSQPDRAAKTLETQESGTVLLIDDDEIVLEKTRVMLSTLGFEVLCTRCGMEAVEMFQHYKNFIRFVPTDFVMPHMSCLIKLERKHPR